MELVCKTLDELPAIAEKIIVFGADIPVWIFEGEMGAGKTTLIKAICEAMGVEGHISSPTYGIVNEYITRNRAVVYHFDFYRIRTEDEAIDMGAEDYLYSGNYCLIEWPSKIPSLIPEKNVKIEISLGEGNSRNILLTKL